MHLYTRNINTAFRELVTLFHNYGEANTHVCNIAKKSSRVGDVLMIEEPVTITYSHPRERVLFNAARGANPFFLLYESLHMLAGRRDIAPLSYYASGYAKHVQDGDRPDANGAYGYRWRHAHTTLGDDQVGPDNFEYDQLQLLIQHLKADPNSRRAVLQMWNVEDDLLKIGHPCNSCIASGIFHKGTGFKLDPDCTVCGGKRLIGQSKDVCCNTAVYFSLRMRDCVTTQGWRKEGYNMEAWGYAPNNWSLDMTVTNRSNDLIWGTLGSDYVNLGFLQEYMAAHLGVEVGVYNQFSNNLHVYTDRFKPEEWLKEENRQPFGFHTSNPDDWGAQYRDWKTVPLIKDPVTFDRELPVFVEHHSRQLKGISGSDPVFMEPFLALVAEPMMHAFHAYKGRHLEPALGCCQQIQANDWRITATQWIERRLSKTAR
jgi:thymidylate synthase